MHQAAGRGPEASESLAKARTIFEALADSSVLDPYNRACAQALSAGLVGMGQTDLSPEDQARRRRFAEQTVATLRQAATGGHHSVEMITSDNDFEAVRPNADFQALIAELKAHAQAHAPPPSRDTPALSAADATTKAQISRP